MQSLNETDVLSDAINENEASLSKLYYWLRFEKHTWILAAGIGWFPHQLILKGLAILAIIFSPYLLWQLFKAGWYKSIATFLGVVILPFLASQMITLPIAALNFLFTILPIITFYIFTWIISYMIGEHLNKVSTLRKWRKEYLINTSKK
ncbi:MAG: hypothetical protein ACQEST_04905 [Bacteroidota bacterium]